MRYILIDPTACTIIEGEHDSQIDHRAMLGLVRCRWIRLIGQLPNGDDLWVDDEGDTPNARWFLAAAVSPHPLPGLGLITGPEAGPPLERLAVDANTTLAEVGAMIRWLK